jgi:hypothetical protein
MAVDVERLVERGDERARDPAGVVGALQVGQQHRELVAAQPGHDVGIAHGAPDAPGGEPQHHVAGRVAERVVGALEAVEVDVQHGQGPALPLRLRQQLLEHDHQVVPVGQLREAVVVRLFVQLLVAGHRRQRHRQPVDRAGQPERLVTG